MIFKGMSDLPGQDPGSFESKSHVEALGCRSWALHEWPIVATLLEDARVRSSWPLIQAVKSIVSNGNIDIDQSHLTWGVVIRKVRSIRENYRRAYLTLNGMPYALFISSWLSKESTSASPPFDSGADTDRTVDRAADLPPCVPGPYGSFVIGREPYRSFEEPTKERRLNTLRKSVQVIGRLAVIKAVDDSRMYQKVHSDPNG
jgi:hypothetical protein